MRNLIQTSYISHSAPASYSCCCFVEDAYLAARIDEESIWVDKFDPEPRNLGQFELGSRFDGLKHEILSMQHLEEEDQVCVIMQSGEIFLLSLSQEPSLELEGSMDETIESAAWSPDGDVLAISTKNKLSLLTRSLDPLADINPSSSDLKMSANQVSVGWGRAETQFRGKHTPRDPTLPESVDEGTLSETDSGKTHLSWRGDGQFLAHSAVTDGRRVIRVYSRNGLLESTSEPVNGHEEFVSWKPNGALVASTKRSPSGLEVIFFEKNGLRHGEFSLRGYTGAIHGLQWNCDGSILAVLTSQGILLWTVSNYHYSLKAILPAHGQSRLTWHPEDAFKLVYRDAASLHDVQLKSDVIIQQPILDNDLALVCMIDGDSLGLTPIKIANVPPPMSLEQLQLARGVPIHVAISRDARTLAVLFSDCVEIYDCIAGGRPMTRLANNMPLPLEESSPNALQVALTQAGDVCVLMADAKMYYLQPNGEQTTTINLSERCIGIFAIGAGIVFQSGSGALTFAEKGKPSSRIAQFSEPCLHFSIAEVEEQLICCGLSAKGKLYANDRLLTSGVTSMLVLGSLIAYTTTTQLHFIHIAAQPDLLQIPVAGSSDERSRQIDRGSLLICACLSAESVTLQAPRGNLETVYPRLLVLAGIRKAIDNGQWRHAWQKAKLHRIDTNILCDYDFPKFMSHMADFVDALESSTELDIFLSGLKAENVSTSMYLSTFPDNVGVPAPAQPDKVARICDAMLVLLQEKYRDSHLTSILTAHLSKQPADQDAALLLVSSLPGAEREDALTHVCFLADAHQLYNRALGLYDLNLALSLAQQSQKDPREYVPFLQAIQKMDVLRQRFTLDDHLGRHDKALCSLLSMQAIEETWQEALRYTRLHNLWQTCLAELRYDRARYLIAVAAYAQDLQERRDFSEAGAAFELVGRSAQASECYTLAGQWQEALQTAQSDHKVLAQRLADDLVERSRFGEAAIVYRDWLQDTESAIKFFGRAFDFTSSLLLAETPEGIERLVQPTLREGFSQLSALLAEMRTQLGAQIPRLAEVRLKRLEQPEAFFDGMDGGEEGEGSGAPDNVSLAGTDATSSTTHSVFTRYTDLTGASGSTSMSRRSGKARRRMERQRARGKKGTIWEEEYLVNSIRRLIERLESSVRLDARKLVMGLVRCGMLVEAGEVQKAVVALIEQAKESMDEVFVGILTLPQELQRTMGERPVLNDFETTTLVPH